MMASRSAHAITYWLPCKPGAVYVNVTVECLNNCRFCIRRDGPLFFGRDLSISGGEPEADEIIRALEALPTWSSVREVVLCGMGEPLLRYDRVLSVCRTLKSGEGSVVRLRIDTSGLFWAVTKRLDITDCIDILSISLNAESSEKYEELCQPRIPGAYAVLRDFMDALKRHLVSRQEAGLRIPDVRLSVVDTSEEEYVPSLGRDGYAPGEFPVPDIPACQAIADSYGWPLIVKRLFRDSRDRRWNDRSFERQCARGETPESCVGCSYRH